MHEQEGCELAYLTNVIEQRLADGRQFTQALAGCRDGRSFVVYRYGESRFRLRPCRDKNAC